MTRGGGERSGNKILPWHGDIKRDIWDKHGEPSVVSLWGCWLLVWTDSQEMGFCGESDLAQTRPSIYKLRDSVSLGVWSNYDVVVTRLGGDECMSQSVCTVTTAACHIMGNLWTAEIGFSQCWELAVQDQCARTAGFWWEPSSRSQIAETSLCPRVMKERGSLWCLLYKSISHTHHGPTLVT